MQLIDRIKERLSKYDAQFKEESNSIEFVPPEGGFAVGFVEDPGNHIVYFEGWHEYFEHDEDALNCFAFGLSDECRLEVQYRGDTATVWKVQSFSNGTWTTDSETGLLFSRFWRKKRVQHLQNHLIERAA